MRVRSGLAWRWGRKDIPELVIRRAAERYVERFGRKPTAVEVNEEEVDIATDLVVVRSRHVLLHSCVVGVAE